MSGPSNLTVGQPCFKNFSEFSKNYCLKFKILHDIICKLMRNTITGFDVEHNRFTLASSVHSHNTRFSKKMNFITERPRTRLGLNCFRYLGPKFWSSVPETFKNLKKIVLSLVIITSYQTTTRSISRVLLYVCFVCVKNLCFMGSRL